MNDREALVDIIVRADVGAYNLADAIIEAGYGVRAHDIYQEIIDMVYTTMIQNSTDHREPLIKIIDSLKTKQGATN